MNRGRIQAQGGDTEESESWAQIVDINKQEGLNLSNVLKLKLTPRQNNERKVGFAKLERFIHTCPSNGASAQVIKSFYDKKNRQLRVDLEIRAGRAFID